MNKVLFKGFFICAAAMLAVSCGNGSGEGKAVEMTAPIIQSFYKTQSISGYTENNSKLELRAKSSAFVNVIYKDIGQSVKKGEVIAELVNPEVMQFEEAVKIELKKKKDVYLKFKKFHKQNPKLTPEVIVTDAKEQYLEVKKEYDKVKRVTDNYIITSRQDGIILKRFINIGEPVFGDDSRMENTLMFVIEENQSIHLKLAVTENVRNYFESADSIQVSFPELRGESFHAEFLDMSSGDSVTLTIDNSEGKLRPGMYAKTVVNTSMVKDALTLPSSAFFNSGDTIFVWKVDDGKALKKVVKRGAKGDGIYELLESDLNEKDQVILNSKSQIKPGMRVRAMELKE
jgi:membrane fusion protein (multidrug efflux system)